MCIVPSPTILSTDEMGRVAAPIFTSVGRGGLNASGDVFVVQSLLNDRLPWPHTPIAVTGIADVETELAIEYYQAAMMGMNPPTGRVDPGSPTYYSLAARPLVNQHWRNGWLKAPGVPPCRRAATILLASRPPATSPRWKA
jgi:hypothetical protein